MIKKLKISPKDIDTWQDYIKNPTDVIDKDKVDKTDDLNDYKFKYDLHGHTLLEANKKVKVIILKIQASI